LIVHKSGQALVSENKFEHDAGWFRKFATFLNCPCIRPPAYRIAEKIDIFFELKKEGYKTELVPEKSKEVLTAVT